MKYPMKLFLVCTGERCNAATRGEECGLKIRDLLKDTNKKMGRKQTVRVVSVSCLDLCDHGPNMLVQPDNTVHPRPRIVPPMYPTTVLAIGPRKVL